MTIQFAEYELTGNLMQDLDWLILCALKNVPFVGKDNVKGIVKDFFITKQPTFFQVGMSDREFITEIKMCYVLSGDGRAVLVMYNFKKNPLFP